MTGLERRVIRLEKARGMRGADAALRAMSDDALSARLDVLTGEVLGHPDLSNNIRVEVLAWKDRDPADDIDGYSGHVDRLRTLLYEATGVRQ